VAPTTPWPKMGWLEPPPWPRGWSGHPKKKKEWVLGQKPKTLFFVVAFWDGRTTPKDLGLANRRPPLAKNPKTIHSFFSFLFFFFFFFFFFWPFGGGRTTPLAMGVVGGVVGPTLDRPWGHPRFPSFFFF
jgi:hypothetical protein